jgi:hypothetical protein
LIFQKEKINKPVKREETISTEEASMILTPDTRAIVFLGYI